MTTFTRNPCAQSEITCAYAAQALAPSEITAGETHIASCPDCQRELESINGRKLVPGHYNYGAPGELDESVWSGTGCTCVLVTSTEDTLR